MDGDSDSLQIKMEDSHYCLKCGSTLFGLDNYISHRKVPCDIITSSKMYDETMSSDGFKIEMDEASTAKIDNRDLEHDKVAVKVEADDFFSSLELQSSSKTSTNPGNVPTGGKSTGGIVTRSKSMLYQDAAKHAEKLDSKGGKTHTGRKKVKKRRLLKPRRKMVKKEGKNQSGDVLRMEDSNATSPGLDRTKEDDEWNLFNHLVIKKDLAEKRVETPGSIKSHTPELFSMSPILMNDELSGDKDVEVDKFLEDEDYDGDDGYLNLEDDDDEFNYAPPKCHTGGKWKPGSLTVRTSPVLWTSQTWDSLLDEDGRNSSAESPTELDRCKALPQYNPPSTHTGGKWKPTETPPIKKQQEVPPVTYTGGKWHPEKRMTPEPPATHTGGKWKPQISPDQTSKTWKNETDSTPAKCSVDDKTLNVIASCQSTSGKCLKTAGGLIQYYCSPCNRRLASKNMYKNHVLTRLHLKRVLRENELEFDSRSIKMFRGLYSGLNNKERGFGKREIKKPEFFMNMDMGTEKRAPKDGNTDKVRRKRLPRKEFIRCIICKTKVESHRLGKHLVSYYHSRRIRLDDPEQQKQVLDNIHSIVRQAPYQCGICKYYFNTHRLFKKHWSSAEHQMKEADGKKFWCALCNFECDTSRSMELHLDSNSHRGVIMAVNKSIPIIIRQKQILNCKFCDKKFRYNFALIRHNHISHGLSKDENEEIYSCQNCKFKASSVKSLQKHVIRLHRSYGKVPYFCSICDMNFETSEDARNHRNSESHRSRKRNSSHRSQRSCPYCLTVLYGLNELKTHIITVHHTLRPKCPKCGITFCLTQEVSHHMKHCSFVDTTDQPKETYRCGLCAYSCSLKADIMYHEILHKGGEGEIRPCPVCSKSFRVTTIKSHFLTHTGERPYSCTACSKSFFHKYHLKAHIRNNHNECADEEGRKPAKGPTCGDAKCKFVAKDEEDMEHHIRVHIAPNVFQCPSCYYQTRKNSFLKRHNRKHVDERPFRCPHCSFRGRISSHLKRHLIVHTSAKPYKCPHCPFRCNVVENLRKHVISTKIHQGRMLYECKMCEYSTNTTKDFKNHLFDKHGDKFATKMAISSYTAEIYTVQDAVKEAANPLPIAQNTSPTQPKTDKSTVRNSIAILSKKCERKTLGNSVQDRRKALEMELEKLKNHAKKKPVKSYPAAKVLRELRPRMVTKSPDNVATKTEQGPYLTVAINQTVPQPQPMYPCPTYILNESGISFEDNEDHLAEQEFYQLENYND